MAVLYLDACCLNRPFDDQRQDRIRLEAEAVERIMERLNMREWEWLGSEVVELEISKTPDRERRRRVTLLASTMHRRIVVSTEEEDVQLIFARWVSLESMRSIWPALKEVAQTCF